MKVYRIKRINDDPDDFLYLFDLRNRIRECDDNVRLNFSNCDFIRPNAVAFIGALYDEINSGNYSCSVDWSTVSERVLMNLKQNGFYYHIDRSVKPWDGNSIRFRKDNLKNDDYSSLINYLRDHCLGRHYLEMSSDQKNEIVSNLLEVYINSTNHGKSNYDIYTCGQFYPGFNFLKLTMLDFGVGIPYNVKEYLNNYDVNDAHAILKAFEEGFSTKDEIGGNGLPQLYGFVKEFAGTLELYSGKGLAVGTKKGIKLYIHSYNFSGTIVHLTLKCDIIYH